MASGTQNFGSANGTVSFSAAIDNTGSMWAGGAPTRVTMLNTGWYRIVAVAFVTGSAMTTDGWAIFKNGTAGISQNTGATLLGRGRGVQSYGGRFFGASVGSYYGHGRYYSVYQWTSSAW